MRLHVPRVRTGKSLHDFRRVNALVRSLLLYEKALRRWEIVVVLYQNQWPLQVLPEMRRTNPGNFSFAYMLVLADRHPSTCVSS